MSDLYVRAGLDAASGQDDVLNSASARWASADGAHTRVEAAELLLGRRINGNEIPVLPVEFTDAIIGGGEFDSVLALASHIADIEHSA